MIFEGKFARVDDRVIRLGDDLAYVDLISTSRGIIRVGAMPEVSKLLRRHLVLPRFVVIPGAVTTVAGDNRTGEEFIFWNALSAACPAGTYVGAAPSLAGLSRYVSDTFPFWFDERLTTIRRMNWLSHIYEPVAVAEGNPFIDGPMRVHLEGPTVTIEDYGHTVYVGPAGPPPSEVEAKVESFLKELPHRRREASPLQVTVIGSGNGFSGNTSSFVIGFGERRLWIDPCARPHESLALANIHWNDVTEVVVTHNHEDHIGGFSACVTRARQRGETLRLLTTKPIFDLLGQQFGDLFPGWPAGVEFVELTPGVILEYGGAHIGCRLNHHILPSGTLGIKLHYGGRTFGLSGDTKFDESLNTSLGRPELEAAWFEGCDLILHEIALSDPRSVHSYYPEVLKFVRQVRGRVLVYHNVGNATPLEFAAEGKTYLV